MLGIMPGTRRQGGQKRQWIDNITKWVGGERPGGHSPPGGKQRSMSTIRRHYHAEEDNAICIRYGASSFLISVTCGRLRQRDSVSDVIAASVEIWAAAAAAAATTTYY